MTQALRMAFRVCPEPVAQIPLAWFWRPIETADMNGRAGEREGGLSFLADELLPLTLLVSFFKKQSALYSEEMTGRRRDTRNVFFFSSVHYLPSRSSLEALWRKSSSMIWGKELGIWSHTNPYLNFGQTIEPPWTSVYGFIHTWKCSIWRMGYFKE